MELHPRQNPIELFKEWLVAATEAELNDPEAMALATVGADGRPSVRMVLLKNADEKGFYFYTNMESKKGQDLALHPYAALCFHWKSQQRQVRVEGRAVPVSAEMTQAYFKTRHPLSQLGAWASAQSRPLESRHVLEERVAVYQEKFRGHDIPCPPHWSGYCVIPEKIEFWQQGEGRLHDRFLFTKAADGWDLCRLNP